MGSLASVGEFAFIDAIADIARARYPRGGIAVGIGDDAAVVAGFPSTLLTTDTLAEGVHFRRDWLSPRALGRRAFRVAVSDIAAMGGSPRYVLLSTAIPSAYRLGDAKALVAGLVSEAATAGAALVGGNVTRGDELALTVTVIGRSNGRTPSRGRARPGQRVYVAGSLGDAAAGVELLRRGCRTGRLVDAYRLPRLRLRLGRALVRSGAVAAIIDVSDGFVQDLGHVCRASQVVAAVDPAAIPLSRALSRAATAGRLRRTAIEYAMGGGDDYELLFTVRRRVAVERIQRLCARHGCVVSGVGEVLEADGGPAVRDPAGRALTEAGYSHFARARGRTS